MVKFVQFLCKSLWSLVKISIQLNPLIIPVQSQLTTSPSWPITRSCQCLKALSLLSCICQVSIMTIPAASTPSPPQPHFSPSSPPPVSNPWEEVTFGLEALHLPGCTLTMNCFLQRPTCQSLTSVHNKLYQLKH